jgi:Ras-related protein Rab-32
MMVSNEITVKSLARVAVGGVFSDDLKRFKVTRAGLTIAKLREELQSQHRGNLPDDFVIKYEWVTHSVSGTHGLSELSTDDQLDNAVTVLCDGGKENSAALPLRLYVSSSSVDVGSGSGADTGVPVFTDRSSTPTVNRTGQLVAGSPRGLLPTVGLSAVPFVSTLPDTPPAAGAQTKELVYKIMVVGNAACGKTSIINRFVNDVFADTYKSTVGADFSRKIIPWDEHTTIRLQLWDIAGQV